MITKWTNEISLLVQQGHFIRIAELEDCDMTWKSFIFDLPHGVMKFVVNVHLDTLPTQSNLRKWGKRSGAKCDLCKSSNETLLHTLNNCPVMLQQGRYTWRHNCILNALKTEFDLVNTGWTIITDLPGDRNIQGPSTVPPHVLPTSQRPDMVLLNKDDKTIVLIELTVCFESEGAMQNAENRKLDRYAGLLMDISDNGYNADITTIEIGSRGMINCDNVSKLNKLFKVINPKLKNLQRQSTNVRRKLSKMALLASYIIFYAKYCNTWNEPDFIKC